MSSVPLTVNIEDVNVMLDIEDVCELCMPTSKMSGVMLDAFGISSKHSSQVSSVITLELEILRD